MSATFVMLKQPDNASFHFFDLDMTFKKSKFVAIPAYMQMKKRVWKLVCTLKFEDLLMELIVIINYDKKSLDKVETSYPIIIPKLKSILKKSSKLKKKNTKPLFVHPDGITHTYLLFFQTKFLSISGTYDVKTVNELIKKLTTLKEEVFWIHVSLLFCYVFCDV